MTTAAVRANDAHRRSLSTGTPKPAAAARADAQAWEQAVLDAESAADVLADQLHRGLLQSLVVALHSLSWQGAGGQPSAPEGLPTADAALRQCLAEARSQVWHLRPRVAEPADLAGAVADLADRVLADGGPTLLWTCVAEPTLAQAVVAYRLVQAAALDATAAGAERLRADISPMGATVVVSVSRPLSSGQARLWAERGRRVGVVNEELTP